MARYSKEFIAEIKSRLRVSDVVGKYVKLSQRGNEFVGLSPFKNEKTPSFTVNDEKEFYHCFSTAEHGDIFSFLMKHKNMSYPESIETLAKQAGLDPERGMIRDKNFKDNNYSALKVITEEAAKFYHLNLIKNQKTMDYLDRRSVSVEIIKKFGLGYADQKGNSLFNYLKDKGHQIKDMISLGLIKKSKDSENYYDFFRNRLMFPIRDYRSITIAFGGRALDSSPIKYINSSDNPIFKKSFQLYNLDLAIKENRKVKDLIIVEGYMDVISLYQNNFKTTVAPLGTALTAYQLERSWKVCENPIILFDGDEAGQKAAIRASHLALNNLKPDLSLRFCTLPVDTDPDDFIKKYGPSELLSKIDKSYSLSEFIWKNEFDKVSLSTPEKKAGFEKRIKSLVQQINNETVKHYYSSYFESQLNNYKFSSKKYSFRENQYNNLSISNEISKSDRADKSSHVSSIRERIIILVLVENPFLLDKYSEELGQLIFNDEKLNKIVSEILEFSSLNANKALENDDLKSYLKDKGFNQLINYLYNPSLISTYKGMIDGDQDIVDKNFLEMINVHKNLSQQNELSEAYLDFEQNMDDESYKNFLKIKNETLKD